MDPIREEIFNNKDIRPYYEQKQVNSEFNYFKPHQTVNSALVSKWKKFSLKNWIMELFPILRWLSNYSIRQYLIQDIIAGSTVAIIHIPQGMGLALLANMPPVCGIYTAFFPVLIYVLFATSKHTAMGTLAVVSILIGKTVLQHADPRYFYSIGVSNSTSDIDMSDLGYSPVQIGSALCFMTGIIQFLMFVFRLGIISSLLSESLVSGLTTGAAIHVIFAQMKYLLGLELNSGSTGYFKIFNSLVAMIQDIGSINMVTLIISIFTIFIMILNNECLKPWLSKRSNLPVPIELILVITGTLASKYFNWSTNNNVDVIGNVPTGIPAIQTPPFELLQAIALDSFVIAMVSYSVTVSMALIFAEKANYEIDFNQELLAMGTGNIFGSFFSCFPFSASLTMSTIQHAVGGRTQLTSLVSCFLLVFVLLWIGPFFELLPICILAAILVSALKGLLLQTKHLFQFWRLNRLDAIIWLSTFLGVVVIAIDIGLLIGIILSLACIFVRGMKPYTCLLGNVPNTDLYLDITRYKRAQELQNIKIFHYCGSLNFATRNTFKSDLYSKIGINLANTDLSNSDEINLKYLIIDFSALSYIDPSGVNTLQRIIIGFQKLSIPTFIVGCSCPSYEMMLRCNLKESGDNSTLYFPTVHDAVRYTKIVLTKNIIA